MHVIRFVMEYIFIIYLFEIASFSGQRHYSREMYFFYLMLDIYVILHANDHA